MECARHSAEGNSFMQESSPAEIAVDPRRYFESVSAVRGTTVRKPVCLYL